MTSKLQITLPKALATQYGIEPGDEIRFEGVAGAIRLIPAKQGVPSLRLEERRRLFQDSDQRLKERWQWLEAYVAAHPMGADNEQSRDGMTENERRRGWTRDSLYDRDICRHSKFNEYLSDNGDEEPVDEKNELSRQVGSMKQLIDTNILIYRINPRDPIKQAIASE